MLLIYLDDRNIRWRAEGERASRLFRPIQCSILSERRVHRPYGMEGGEPGALGMNLWIKRRRAEDGDLNDHQPGAEEDHDVRMISLGGKRTVMMGKHDRIRILTPGGGGWGVKQPADGQRQTRDKLLADASGPATVMHQLRGSLQDRHDVAHSS